ncbi:MAG: class I SAM-dependent methyltransferase [bacterium]
MPLPSGIPTIHAYLELIEGPLYRGLAEFSDDFLRKTRRDLRQYAHKWVADPMQQWSRRWEYPFNVDQIAAEMSRHANERITVLDAGSGITFFPYYLASKGADVRCCDIDESLTAMFAHVNRVMGSTIPFQAASLSKLPYDDSAFDAVCCISVLEHCADYSAIVDEFFRVLRPNGLLVLSFDISLDDRGEIPRAEARELLDRVSEQFALLEDGAAPLERLTSHYESDLLTTKYAQKHDPASLPWGILSDLKSLARFRIPSRPHKYLTCCAVAMRSRKRS